MSTKPAGWYVAAIGEPPSGPYTTEEVIDACRTGRFLSSMVCWREGMTERLPLARARPFAAAVRTPSAAEDRATEPLPLSETATKLAACAIVLAVAAFLLMFVPFADKIAAYSAGFALVLSLTGVTIAAASKSRVGFPVAALVISSISAMFIALVLFSNPSVAVRRKRRQI